MILGELTTERLLDIEQVLNGDIATEVFRRFHVAIRFHVKDPNESCEKCGRKRTTHCIECKDERG